MSEKSAEERVLIALMRLGAVITGCAFFAVLMPVEWMAATNRWLGLEEFPRLPLVDYLARSLSALYGFHGVLLWVTSTDIRRYRGIVVFLGWMQIALGLMMLGIDLSAGMPAWWTWGEGPGISLIGCLFLYLVRKVPNQG